VGHAVSSPQDEEFLDVKAITYGPSIVCHGTAPMSALVTLEIEADDRLAPS
jgi:hypothetical protein